MSETTTQKIAGAARQLLDEGGAEGVSMRRVASAVGITPMALYRHYANRDGLLNALADEGFAELSGRLERLRLTGSIDRQLIKILDVFLDYAFEKPRLFELMFLPSARVRGSIRRTSGRGDHRQQMCRPM